MKNIFISVFAFFALTFTATSQTNPSKLIGKSIYCFKTVNTINKEGTVTSFREPNSYPYLMKILLNNGSSYRLNNRLREIANEGKYKFTSDSIILTTSGSGSKSIYKIISQTDNFITMKMGDTIYYCLIDAG